MIRWKKGYLGDPFTKLTFLQIVDQRLNLENLVLRKMYSMQERKPFCKPYIFTEIRKYSVFIIIIIKGLNPVRKCLESFLVFHDVMKNMYF